MKPRNGQLRFWWIPQFPMVAFEYEVDTIHDALLLYDAFAKYDMFQYENSIKPDYANAGGLVIWDDDLEEDEFHEKWTEWEDDEGNDISFLHKGLKYNLTT